MRQFPAGHIKKRVDMVNSGSPQSGTQGSVALNRSCEKCRERKIKCFVGTKEHGDSEPQCARCEKLSLDCVFLPPIIRKKRKRNETKIRELEQKLQEIENAVSRSGDEGASGVPQSSETTNLSPCPTSAYAKLTDKVASQFQADILTVRDPITCGLLDDNTAQMLTRRFCNELAPIYPLVIIPTCAKWTDLRNDKPALLFAILTAAASSINPKLFQMLFDYTSKYLAEEVVVHGRKSLELVQALLIMATWHHPAERFQELKFSQYAHMAATMVSDLRSANDTNYDIPPASSSSLASKQVVEVCRTFLASYFMCSSISLTLRRQNQFQYGQWVEDCIINLLKSTDVELNDMRLVEWVRLQRIVEEGFEVLGVYRSCTVDFSNARTRYVLNSCVQRVLKWRQGIPNELITVAIDLHYNVLLVNLYEPALYEGHDMMDFRPPYRLRSLPLMNKAYNEIPLDAADALNQCIMRTEAIMHAFLNLSTRILRCVPVIMFARIAYAAVVLIKFDVSARNFSGAASLLQRRTTSKDFLMRVIQKLRTTMGEERFQIPTTFHGILSKMATWHMECIDPSAPFINQHDDVIEPMKQLSIESYSVGEIKESVRNSQCVADKDSNESQSKAQWNTFAPTVQVWSDNIQESTVPNFSEMFTGFNIAGYEDMYY